MVSSWTVAISYQCIDKLLSLYRKIGDIDFRNELERLHKGIKQDFKHYLIKDNIVSGFIYFTDRHSIEYIIHPDDQKTFLTYRLIPMTRCILAEIFSKEEAYSHYHIIKKYLDFPDGEHDDILDALATAIEVATRPVGAVLFV